MLKKTVLRRKKDFDTIYNKGKSFGERYVVLFIKKNNLPYNRIAFLASKKVGNSVKRNRARRLMRESFREIKENIAEGYDIVFVARKTINDLKCRDVKISLTAAVKKTGAFIKSD
jgi:ribonuclease P protein component